MTKEQALYSEVIKQCAEIARVSLPDRAVVKHYDGDVIPREPVIKAMLRIKEAVQSFVAIGNPVERNGIIPLS